MPLASQPENVRTCETDTRICVHSNDKKQHNTEEQVNEWKRWGELVAKQNLNEYRYSDRYKSQKMIKLLTS